MHSIPYKKGLHRLSDSVYAYLLPDGSWGLNNTGLVINDGKTMAIDTLYDLALTRELASSITQITGTGKSIDYLVNTHANGDHFYGNELFPGAQIIASKATLEEMKEMLPGKMALFANIYPLLGPAGFYFHKHFSKFNFKGINVVLPSRTFDKELELMVGKLKVQLIMAGPAHTKGDTLVFIPQEKVCFAADLLFIGGTPIAWAGPVRNWIAACDRMLAMDAEIFVPGHGPVTDKKGVTQVKAYFEYIYAETQKRAAQGMDILEAALDIDLKEFGQWTEKERIAANVAVIYQELNPAQKSFSAVQIFALMARYLKKSNRPGR